MPESPKSENRVSPVLIVITFFTLLALVAIITMTVINNQPNTATVNDLAIVEGGLTDDGITEVNPPRPIADFTLTSTTNQPANFSDSAGTWRVIYFGFTNCPDFCPTTLLDFEQIKTGLGEQANNVTFMMISVDGERDTPEALGTYLARFDAAFVGLTGAATEIQVAADEFGVYFGKVDNPESDFYTVDHTVSTFLVNPVGEFVALYSFGTDVQTIIEDLQARF
jgi:protein SCO1/2